MKKKKPVHQKKSKGKEINPPASPVCYAQSDELRPEFREYDDSEKKTNHEKET